MKTSPTDNDESQLLGKLHATIIRGLVDTGRAPRITDLAAALACPSETVRGLLHQLEAHHGVVLHAHSNEVWIAHPFSTAPTLFSVHAGSCEQRCSSRNVGGGDNNDMIWWANCAWCALGAASLIGHDCRIITNIGGHGKPAQIDIINGELAPTDLLIHFPIGVAEIWNNVVYSCSTMLVFERESDIDSWCHRHGIAKGDVRPISAMWPFAREWYGGHLSESWRKVSIDEARAMFARYGLDGAIWALPAADGRF